MGCNKGVPCNKDLLGGTAKKKTKVNPVKSLAKSIKEWAKAGFPLAHKTEHAKRFATCCACSMLVGHMCTKCGCVAYAKTKLKTEKCPIGKW